MRLPRRLRSALVVILASLGLTTTAGFAAEPIRVPFQVQANKLFVVIAVQGVKVDAVIDSGAEFSVLDQAFARTLGVKTRGHFTGVGLQGRVSGVWADGVSLTLGAARLDGVRAGVVDLAELSRQLHRPVQAAIGRELFDRYVVDLDFTSHSLALYPRDGFEPPANARLVALTPAKGRMTADLTLEGGPPLKALIDLGSDLPLILSPSRAARRLFDGRPASTTWLGGYGAGAVGDIVTAHSLQFGGESLVDVPVVVAPRSIGFDGNLGLPVLSRFHLYLDFGARRMWLGPGPVVAAPFYKDRTGFSGFVDDQGLHVLNVAKGGPAAKAGWKAGEVVTQINGEPVAIGNVTVADAQAGAVIAFRMANGETRRLTLADYY